MQSDAVREALTGPVPSISTPFLRDGSIDFAGLRTMIDFYVDHGSKASFLTAGDSHYICMSEQEIAEVTRVTVDHTAGRALVVAADRYYNTQKAVAFAHHVRELGADVLMVMPPDWGHSATPESLCEHYRAVAQVMPVMLVTNVFVPRGADFGLRTLSLLLEEKIDIVAVKDDFCGLFARKMALLVNGQWAVFSGGQKTNHMDIMPYGCDGYLSTYMKFKPSVAKRYWEAVCRMDLPAARTVIRDCDMPYFDLISSLPGGFNAGLHGALELFGVAQRWRRKPYYSLDDEQMERLADFFRGKSLL